jgi:uncharacterized protein with von Willebrand factor type A (vWA) domain
MSEQLPDFQSVIKHTRYDEHAFLETMRQFPRLLEVVKEASQKLPSAAALVADIFYSMFQPAPQLESVEGLSPAATIHHALLENLMNTSQWANVRGKNIGSGTIGDQLYAGIATTSVSRSMLKALDAQTIRRLRLLQEAEQEGARLFNQAETYDTVADEKKDRAEELHQRAEQARKQARKAQEKANQQAAGLANQAEAIEDATRNAAREALEQAQEEIDSLEAAMQAYGAGSTQGIGGQSGLGISGSGTSMVDKLQLATRVGKSTKLKQVAELTGRMTRIAMEVQRTKTDYPPTHITGVETGRNIANLLPTELALLGDSRLHGMFGFKYATASLMQYKLKGLQPQGRGPVIVALDDSGSMSGYPEIWAKACALALLAIARLQERDFALIHFSNSIKTFEFPRGEATPQQVMHMTEFFFGGGTNFWPWMEEALRLVETSVYAKADVICISDGAAFLTTEQEQQWNERRKAKEMRCRSILIGRDATSEQLLGHIGETITTIDDLSLDDAVLQNMYSI